MKKLILGFTTLLAVMAFVAFSTTSVVAEDHKCGEGKCGSEKSKPAAKCGEGKCGTAKGKVESNITAESNSTMESNTTTESNSTAVHKCGEGKCGTDKPKAASKCGEGKCGGK